MSTLKYWLVIIAASLTAMVGYHIHGDLFWAVIDFFFWPWALLKWLFYGEINLTVIRETFGFLLK